MTFSSPLSYVRRLPRFNAADWGLMTSAVGVPFAEFGYVGWLAPAFSLYSGLKRDEPDEPAAETKSRPAARRAVEVVRMLQ